MENKSGIYQIRNLVNGKIYVGSAIKLRNRWNVHLCGLRNNKHHSIYLQKSYHKHGECNFIFEVLEYVELKENLIEREQYYLDTLSPHYNICKTAGSVLGHTVSQEARDKISKAGMGRKQSQESILKTIESRKWYSHSEETRLKMSESSKGKPKSEEHKEKMRIGNLKKYYTYMIGRVIPREIVEKSKASNLLVPKQTCIHCGKLASISKIARWHNDHCLSNPDIDLEKEMVRRKQSDEVVAKRSKATTGRPLTEEMKAHKRNMRELVICPHCNYSGLNKGSLSRVHFDNCKLNPNYDHEAARIALEQSKRKVKEALSLRPLIKCPHCTKESYNKGNMVLNHFNNCKNKV